MSPFSGLKGNRQLRDLQNVGRVLNSKPCSLCFVPFLMALLQCDAKQLLLLEQTVSISSASRTFYGWIWSYQMSSDPLLAPVISEYIYRHAWNQRGEKEGSVRKDHLVCMQRVLEMRWRFVLTGVATCLLVEPTTHLKVTAARVKTWFQDSWEWWHMLKTRVFWLQCNHGYDEIICYSMLIFWRVFFESTFFSIILHIQKW